MSTPNRKGAEFALVGFFTFVEEEPTEVLRAFEEIDPKAVRELEEKIREVFFRASTSTEILLYPAIVPTDYAQEAIQDFHRMLETGEEE